MQSLAHRRSARAEQRAHAIEVLLVRHCSGGASARAASVARRRTRWPPAPWEGGAAGWSPASRHSAASSSATLVLRQNRLCWPVRCMHPVPEFVGDRESPTAGPLLRLGLVDPDLAAGRKQQARERLAVGQRRASRRGGEIVDLANVQAEPALGDVLDRDRQPLPVPDVAGQVTRASRWRVPRLAARGEPTPDSPAIPIAVAISDHRCSAFRLEGTAAPAAAARRSSPKVFGATAGHLRAIVRSAPPGPSRSRPMRGRRARTGFGLPREPSRHLGGGSRPRAQL